MKKSELRQLIKESLWDNINAKKKAGKKIKDIIVIPVKKKNVNIKFLIITKKTI